MIYADSNEQATCNIVNILREWGVPVIVRPQGFDYVVEHKDCKVAVERKTAADYLGSLECDHLNNQLVEMSRNFQKSYLVTYGDMNLELFKREKYPASYISSLIGSSLKHAPDGLQGDVITINDTAISTEHDFATFLKHLNLKLEAENFIRLPKITRVKLTDEDYALRLLVQLPSIGEKRAREILLKYSTFENFVNEVINGDPTVIRGITSKLHEQYKIIFTKSYEGGV